ILQLYRPTSGTVYFENQNLCNLKGEALRRMRRRMQMIFQDPYASLNPRMTVGQIVGEPLEVHNILKGKALKEKVRDLLQIVGLNPYFINRYPHEFSGGQRQRIAIARAVVLEPEVILLDEPTSALDVSVQKQVLGLLAKLQKKHGLSYIFISHDLRVIRAMSHRIIVMKEGEIVEQGSVIDVLDQPQQAYTKELALAAYA
ncbi:MAG: ATP-binding cassette domain-containing protein, partial [Gammaproteobacteria bacterium]